PEVSRLTELKLGAIEAAIGVEIDAGGGDVGELDRRVSEYPQRERIRALHMRALYAAGRQADALTSYKVFRDQLADDLGLDPSPELQELELRILQQDPSLSPLAATPSVATVGSLPIRYSSFVGRAEEIAAVSARIAADRLVTVVGPGGIGKSSLVVEAARGAEVHRGDPVTRVVVDTLGDGEIVDALVRSLGLAPAPGVDPSDVVVGFLIAHTHLLILDGCEAHLEFAARLADRLLSSSPQTRILATSREPLGLAGEAIIRVGGLDLATAAELFADRADLANLDDEASGKVEELCAALDGMPLAIELAASRARSIPLDRLVQRLDDLVPLLRKSRISGERHDSIATALGWSYDLLEDAEQRALRWLSVFPRGCELRDAEAVLEDPHAEDVLARLVDVSLVQPTDESGRHRMLEPVRQYAEYLLEAGEELDGVGERLARWIAVESQRVGAEIWSHRALSAAAWIHDRHSDVLSAIDWALNHDQPDVGVEIVASIGFRVANEGAVSAFVDGAVKLVRHPAAQPTGHLATALAHTAWMLWGERSDDALELLERAGAITKALDDPAARGEVLQRRAVVDAVRDGIDTSALQLLDEAIEQLRAAGVAGANRYLWNRAIFLLDLGRFDEALETAAEREAWSLATMGLGDPDALEVRGETKRLTGNSADAVRLYLDAALLHRASYRFDSEQHCWDFVAFEAIGLDDQVLLRDALECSHQAREKTGGEARAPLQVRVASYADEHRDVLVLSREWTGDLLAAVDADGHRHLADALDLVAWHESPFFEVLLPIALAFEATGRVDDARQIAREAPGLMAQASFQHWEEIGEAQRWAELLDRLGASEPEGLTLEEAFGMVHDMLNAEPVA
ncbi:MAG: BTAD domain-containing putative transcriptional regulator, partial [Acidimicrobiia bacterium]